ncbi:MAG: hypothetical protein IT265_04080 [Saprospiraceae bacterium]|nr:hypothetical protein [Saprospiraceae bacterium]
MKIKTIIIFLLLTTISCSTTKQNQIVKSNEVEDRVNCSLELNKDSFQIGEHLTIFFVIKNLTNQPIYISNSPYNSYLIDGKRLEEGYDIRIKNEDEIELKQTFTGDIESGRFGITKIEPQEQLKIRIHDIFKYAITANYGTYTIDFDKRFFIYMNKKENRKYYENNPSDFKTKILITKSDKINVLVEKRR